MSRLFIILASLVALTGCEPIQPVSTTTTPNGVQVNLLVEKDGVKVYEFSDEGHPVYFTVPATAPVSWRQQRGKTQVTVQTN